MFNRTSSFYLFIARVRSTREGNIDLLSLSVCSPGGGVSGGVPWPGPGLHLPPGQDQDRAHPCPAPPPRPGAGQGAFHTQSPGQDQDRAPSLGQGAAPPPPPLARTRTRYAEGGTPLAVTQEECLVVWKLGTVYGNVKVCFSRRK